MNVIRSLKHGLLELVVFFPVVALLAWGAHSRNRVWNEALDLWKDTVRKSPGKARPYGNLGLAYLNAGDYEKAFEMTQRRSRSIPNLQKGITT